MIKLLEKIASICASWGPVGTSIAFCIGVLISAITFFNDLWNNLFAKIDAMITPNLPSGFDLSPLALMNYIVPFDTMLTYTTALFGLYVVCVIIRIVKSFIPTVA